MSDEEEFDSERYDSDVDDEGKVFENEVDKRAYHNLLERKRRDIIKVSFCRLRDVVPTISSKKKPRASRVQILRSSYHFLKHQPDFQKLKEEMLSLEEENKLLRKSIADADKANENNDEEALARLQAMNLPLKRRHFLLESEDTDSEDADSSDDDSSSSPPQPSPVVVGSSSRRKIKKC